eukprot:160526-Prymnesium_polylepis.1
MINKQKGCNVGNPQVLKPKASRRLLTNSSLLVGAARLALHTERHTTTGVTDLPDTSTRTPEGANKNWREQH